MRRERSASSSDGMRSAPVPPILGETGAGADDRVRRCDAPGAKCVIERRNAFGPRAPNPGGDRSRGR